MHEQGYDLVVGARDTGSPARIGRLVRNPVYNRLASWMVGHRVEDLTSGFRAVDAAKFREFLHESAEKYLDILTRLSSEELSFGQAKSELSA